MRTRIMAASGLVAGVVALSVLVASPAFADGAGLDSITANPANVAMLANDGMITVPATTTATAAGATASTTAAVGTTAASAAGGTLGGLLRVTQTSVGAFNMYQTFTAGGQKVQGAATMTTDGVRDQTVTVPAGADLGTAGAGADPSSAVGKYLCNGSGSTLDCWVIYGLAGSGTGTVWCLYGTLSGLDGPNPVYVMTQGQTSMYSSSSTATSPPSGCSVASQPTGSPYPVPSSTHYKQLGVYPTGDLSYPIWGWGVTNRYSSATPLNLTSKTSITGSFSRTLICRPSSGADVTVQYNSPQMTLSASQSFNLPDMTCPAGTVAIDTTTNWVPAGGGSTVTIVPPAGTGTLSPQIQKALAYPNCATGSCTLVLTKANGDSCGPIGQLCPDWAKDPNYTSDYKCTYGGQPIDIGACSAYRLPQDGILPNIDSQGNYVPATAPAPATYGVPTTDPTTGSAPAPIPNDNQGDPWHCRPDSLMAILNPFNMFSTIGCAMRDAFQPRQEVVNQDEQLVTAVWKASSVGVLGNAIGAFYLAPPGQDCSGIVIDTSWLGQGGYIKGAPTTAHFLAACPGDYFEHIAPIVNGLLTAGIAVMALLALGRLLGRFAGYTGVSGE